MELLLDFVLLCLCVVGAVAFVVWLVFNIVGGVVWFVCVAIVSIQSRIEQAHLKRKSDIH